MQTITVTTEELESLLKDLDAIYVAATYETEQQNTKVQANVAQTIKAVESILKRAKKN